MRKQAAPISYPAGCGPPRQIAVVLSAEQLAVASALGFGFPAKGVRAAIDQLSKDRADLHLMLLQLRLYKAQHPEHDWEIIQTQKHAKELSR